MDVYKIFKDVYVNNGEGEYFLFESIPAEELEGEESEYDLEYVTIYRRKKIEQEK